MNSDCGNIIRQTVKKNVLLAVGIVIAVCGAVVISLLPPLVLAKMIDAMTQKQNVGFTFVALYFGLTALTGVMEASRVYKTDGRQFKQTGTGRIGITVCR